MHHHTGLKHSFVLWLYTKEWKCFVGAVRSDCGAWLEEEVENKRTPAVAGKCS